MISIIIVMLMDVTAVVETNQDEEESVAAGSQGEANLIKENDSPQMIIAKRVLQPKTPDKDGPAREIPKTTIVSAVEAKSSDDNTVTTKHA